MKSASERLARSLLPSTRAPFMLNAVAVAFFNPALSLDQAFETAKAIEALKPRKKRSTRKGKR